jgi:hypothetical protein
LPLGFLTVLCAFLTSLMHFTCYNDLILQYFN